MSYTSSVSVGTLDNFITSFINFAVSYAGFTNEGSFTDSGTLVQIISKGSIYWNFYTILHARGGVSTPLDHKAIQFRMTYVKPTTLAEVLSVAGSYRPGRMTVWRNTGGPYSKYYLYTEGNVVHCIIEVYSSVFNHLSFGNITKIGTWTGGEYITGGAVYYSSSTPSYDSDASHVWNAAVFNGNSDQIASNSFPSYFPGYIRRINGSLQSDENDFSRLGTTEVNDQMSKMNLFAPIMDGIYNNTPNQFNLRSPALPMYCNIWDETKQTYGLQGYVPEVRVINNESIADADLVETDWQVFSITQKSSGNNTLAPLSENYGLMYKRTAPEV